MDNSFAEAQVRLIEDELAAQTRIFEEAKRRFVDPAEVDLIRAKLVSSMQQRHNEVISELEQVNKQLHLDHDDANTEHQEAVAEFTTKEEQLRLTIAQLQGAVAPRLDSLHTSLSKANDEMIELRAESEEAVRRHQLAAHVAEAQATTLKEAVDGLEQQLEQVTLERDQLLIEKMGDRDALNREKAARAQQRELMAAMETTLTDLYTKYREARQQLVREKEKAREKREGWRDRRRALTVDEGE